MKSFGILRTNPGLTTNIKIMVDSKYGLSLDSINSSPELSSTKFKKVDFNKSNYYDELIPYFYDGLPSETAYTIKYDDDSYTMTMDFADQYDEIYQYGARNIVNNKSYEEEYEYFAPLYVRKKNLPKNFIIFRVDGPGIGKLGRENFKNEIISKLKTVKLFDLTKKNALGEWLSMNIDDNEFFPETPFEMSFQRLEFSKWNGIEYKSGGYISKSLFLDDVLEEEKEIFEMEKFIFDGYKNNKVVFPNILNLSFLFDDTPADEQGLRKWSMNRYYGFYIDDMERVSNISPYSPPSLKSGFTIIDGNILHSDDGDPFVDGWKENSPMYVEFDGTYYKVEKFTVELPSVITPITMSTTNSAPKKPSIPKKGGPVTVSSVVMSNIDNSTIIPDGYISDDNFSQTIDKWRIISDINLVGKESKINSNVGTIGTDKKLRRFDGTFFDIEDFDRSDVWIIEVDGIYHNLVRQSDGSIMLSTDYGFEFGKDFFRYFVNRNIPGYTTTVSIKVDSNNTPKSFPIYRLNFSDIKDFDTRIVDTEPSKFEYDVNDEIVYTDETKLYFTDQNSSTLPKQLDDFIYKDKVVNIPVSSEYTSNQETFKVTGGQLSPIWRKNPVYCRWCYDGSLSANDYPYILNNSLKFESHNRTTNTFDPNPNRFERNLDYFYTINSSSPKYSHHTLHIEKSDIYGIDKRFDFRHDSYEGLTKYVVGTTSVSIDYDYFSTILNLKSAFDNGKTIKNTKKYSMFISGDNSTPNNTLFRGIKFSLYDVNNIKTDQNGQIETINTTNNNTFENYKFSIVLTAQDNGMQWDIIDRWKMDRKYKKGDIVIYDDVLYIAANDTICDSPSVIRWGREDVAITNENPTGLIYSKYLLKPAPYNMLAYKSTDAANKAQFRVEYYDNNPANTGNDWLIYQPNDELANEIYGSIFWSPLDELETNYKNGNVVYKDGDYYTFNEVGSISFWNPLYAIRLTDVAGDPTKSERRGYSAGIIVLYNKFFYKSKVNNNMYPPENQKYWEKIDYDFINSKWRPVPVWIPNLQYNNDSYVVHNSTLYKAVTTDKVVPFNTIPGKSKLWTRLYSLVASTSIVYGRKYNSIIQHNGEYYRIVNNPNGSTLDNGIKIYINHKYKNVLINIYVNDNTIPNLKNSNRDQMYTSINKKLTAKNFIDSINNLTLRNGFSDYIRYVVIDKNGIKKQYGYGSNLTKLPHLLLAERPEQILIKVDSLEVIPINESKLKPKKTLSDGKITEISQLNHFNNTHHAVDILQTNDVPNVIKNYSGMSPISDNVIFRFSGNYMPLFYDVQLFNTDNSIEYKRIDLMFEISCKQNINFRFDINGNKSMNSYEILPGASFSNTFDYYTQIVPILNNNFPNIDFLYEVTDKSREKRRIGEILDLDDDSYNKNDSIWYDMGHNEGFATLVPGTASPVYRTSDLYPGNHFEFFGNSNLVSLINTSTPIDNALSFEFFIKFSDVDTLSSFMGNGKLVFGVEGKRAFMKNEFLYEDLNAITPFSPKAIYTDPVLENDVWYHLVFCRSNDGNFSNTSIFLDGRNAVATDSPTGLTYEFIMTDGKPGHNDRNYELVTTSGSIKYVIGGSIPGMENNNLPLTAPYYAFSGCISSIRLYDRVLSEEEAREYFISEHKTLSIKYRATEGDIKLELHTDEPKLILNIEDDPSISYYNLQVGATGGNTPYMFSVNGSQYSYTPTYFTNLQKNTTLNVTVKDFIGLTSSAGYYTINGDINSMYEFNGTITY